MKKISEVKITLSKDKNGDGQLKIDSKQDKMEQLKLIVLAKELLLDQLLGKEYLKMFTNMTGINILNKKIEKIEQKVLNLKGIKINRKKERSKK